MTDFLIQQNCLVGVVGKVGSGKTTLLLSMIGELEMHTKSEETEFSISGNIGYCSQVAWIFNATIKENILFGNIYDEEWYNKVVYSCSLYNDFADMPNKDETIIGERGSNLSGGQKARINLARCIYGKPNILLLDDVLSCVDSIVAKHIFTNVLHNHSGLMKNTIRILVTNQTNILHEMDNIITIKNQRVIKNDN
eukprot:15751_1